MTRCRPALEGRIRAVRLRRVTVATLTCAALGWWVTDTAQLQDAPAPLQPTFRTGVNLVRVDVTVTGRGDAPVADLQASDFEIREDGVPQTIETLQFIRLTGKPAPGDDLSLEIRSREHGRAEIAREDVRVFGLFLDDYHISEDPGTTQRLRQALTDWVDTALEPTDVVVVMDPLTPISALEYTRSAADLHERIEQFKGRRGVYVPVRSAVEEEQLRTGNPARLRAEVTLTALNALVTHIGTLRDRRASVIFVSEGPPVYFWDVSIEHHLRDLFEAANRFNVTINVMDPRGLTSGSPRDTLWRLSSETGGRAIVNTNGLRAGLERVTQDASAYYLIGYEPSNTQADGLFRKIDVTVRRRGVDVLARSGYWALSEEELNAVPAPEAPPALTAALNVFTQLEGSRQAITWIGFEPAPAGATRVAFSCQPHQDVGRSSAAAEAVFVVAQSGSGPELPERRIVLRQDGRQGSPLAGTTSFEVDPGPLTLALRLETESGEIIDSWTERVQVPSFPQDAVNLGTPRVLVAHSALDYRAIAAAPNDAVPSPLREFRRSDRVIVRMLVSGSTEPPEAGAVLLNRAGDELVRWPLTVGVDSVVQTELPLGSLASSDYVLKLQILESPEPAAQHVAFRVVP